MKNHWFDSRVQLATLTAIGVLVFASMGSNRHAPQRTKGLIADVQELKEQVRRLQTFDPPVGTVMAYLGEWPPYKDKKKQRFTEDELGWMLCDGRERSAEQYEELFIALQGTARDALQGTTRDKARGDKHFRLPNLQGQFLRGVDQQSSGGVDPDGKRQVGSKQSWATACPKKLKDSAQNPYVEIPYFDQALQGIQGDSAHYLHSPKHPGVHETQKIPVNGGITTQGWDTETRPVNIAVHWIIKFRSKP